LQHARSVVGYKARNKPCFNDCKVLSRRAKSFQQPTEEATIFGFEQPVVEATILSATENDINVFASSSN